jgi:hypothetical protein
VSGGAAALGWAGLLTGLAGLVVYIVVALRRPEAARLLNGSGLLLTSMALLQARILVEASLGGAAFAVQASIALLILAVIAQAAAALRNRRAWDGAERRRPPAWDGRDRRGAAPGEEHA